MIIPAGPVPLCGVGPCSIPTSPGSLREIAHVFLSRLRGTTALWDELESLLVGVVASVPRASTIAFAEYRVRPRPEQGWVTVRTGAPLCPAPRGDRHADHPTSCPAPADAGVGHRGIQEPAAKDDQAWTSGPPENRILPTHPKTRASPRRMTHARRILIGSPNGLPGPPPVGRATPGATVPIPTTPRVQAPKGRRS